MVQVRASAGNDVAEVSSVAEGDFSPGMGNGATSTESARGAPVGVSSNSAADPSSGSTEEVAPAQLRLSVQVVTGIDKVRT